MNSPTFVQDKERVSLAQADDAGVCSDPEACVTQPVSSQAKESVIAIVPSEADDVPRYLHGFKLFVIMSALLLSMFLVGLSSTPMLSGHSELTFCFQGCIGYGE